MLKIKLPVGYRYLMPITFHLQNYYH